MGFRLEFDETVDLLRDAVEERGENYVYEKPPGSAYCEYVHSDGTPGCIVGWVLAKKGAKPEDFEGESEAGHSLNSTGVDDLFRSEFIEADERTRQLLSIAQGKQDGQFPWG